MSATPTDCRLGFLWKASHQIFAKHPALSRYLASKFLDLSKRNGTPLSDTAKKSVCFRCGTYVVPGVNSKVATVHRARKRRQEIGAAEAEAVSKTSQQKRLKSDAPIAASEPSQCTTAEENQPHTKPTSVPARSATGSAKQPLPKKPKTIHLSLNSDHMAGIGRPSQSGERSQPLSSGADAQKDAVHNHMRVTCLVCETQTQYTGATVLQAAAAIYKPKRTKSVRKTQPQIKQTSTVLPPSGPETLLSRQISRGQKDTPAFTVPAKLYGRSLADYEPASAPTSSVSKGPAIPAKGGAAKKSDRKKGLKALLEQKKGQSREPAKTGLTLNDFLSSL
ncbi:uncharacterized protein BJ171DRAFT_509129 [Polychytrium aggregatum]|uniref:uncharacterized protein n=1 Tax=Polychytrium aggregatum TaxID=110093 RepID=UPI0022FDB5E5|nr:uncharacterized protein BJ171DRAFT_509129 [Polychytrium aggregatum]KAI9203630.1 hypothetical protein BJ171DRAFT_509129 [Polychytrium aggregatum]